MNKRSSPPRSEEIMVADRTRMANLGGPNWPMWVNGTGPGHSPSHFGGRLDRNDSTPSLKSRDM
jgi:hypothetical protein